MDVNNFAELKDGDSTRSLVIIEAPSIVNLTNPKSDGNVKKKRRRGKAKRKIMKPYLKISWQERRRNEARNSKRNKRFRKIVLAKTQAPFNNNQFLMEIHKPEPENNIFRAPSARTRDSSFSIDSEDNNYFFSLPEDEEEYLTKEFSSVYEDAQCERLSNMSKNELIEEYLLLEAKYDTLVKRAERYRSKDNEEYKCVIVADKDSKPNPTTLLNENEFSGPPDTVPEKQTLSDILQRLQEQEEQIRELQSTNEKLRVENEHLQQQNQTMSEDSESDSSSSSDSCSTSSSNSSPIHEPDLANNENPPMEVNGNHDSNIENGHHLMNGFHSPTE